MSTEKTPEEIKKIREMMSAPFDPALGIQENNEPEQEVKPEKKHLKKIEKNNKRFNLSCSSKESVDVKLLLMAYNSVKSTNCTVSKMIFNVLNEYLENNPEIRNRYEKLQKFV